ncbi:hypothetical protein JTB14_037988 [Gonioctena quinquepunctata]|nr:hypothetical protein JTB14_037988 [Gonioctena quinquepunctata]
MITYILNDVEIDIMICVVQKPPVETPSEVAIIHEEERMVKRLENTSKSEDRRVKNHNENNRFKVILIEDYCLRPNEKSKMEVEIVGLPKTNSEDVEFQENVSFLVPRGLLLNSGPE